MTIQLFPELCAPVIKRCKLRIITQMNVDFRLKSIDCSHKLERKRKVESNNIVLERKIRKLEDTEKDLSKIKNIHKSKVKLS